VHFTAKVVWFPEIKVVKGPQKLSECAVINTFVTVQYNAFEWA